MPKTLDDIQSLLTRSGYTCERMVDVIVATTVKTKVYKNPAGENALEIMVTFDHANHCVAVEVLQAFALSEADHKEAALACLMTAAGRTPLLRPTLEPEGTVGLRIDCTCGRNGARESDVLQALALLESWVEVWFPQVSTAMTHGRFNAHEVPHLNLLRMGRNDPTQLKKRRSSTSDDAGGPSVANAKGRVGPKREQPADTGAGVGHESAKKSTDDGPDHDVGATEDGPQDGEDRGDGDSAVARAAAIAEKPGAHPNRLRVLFEFFRKLDEENRGRPEQN